MKVRYLLIGVTVLFIVGLLTTSSYAKLDPKTCVGIWLFDEAKGDIATDFSGNKNDGKLMGGPKWVDGKFGKALEFDGSGSYVNIPNTESLNSASFTISLWAKPSQLRIQGLADKTPAPQWRVFMCSAAGNIEFDGMPGEIANIQTPVTVVGRWDHIVATYDSSSKTAKIYFNGVMSQQAAGIASMNTTNAANIHIASAENSRFNGAIDEVAIFNVALVEGDIQIIMDKGLKETLKPSAVDLSGKLAATWASIKAR
jgi:hypothetical protein